jgi:FkbM family methyltransferase
MNNIKKLSINMSKMDEKSYKLWDFASSENLIGLYKKYFNSCETLLEIGSLHGKNAEQIQKALNIKNTYIIEANPFSYNIIKTRYKNYNIYNYAFGDDCKKVKFNSVIRDNPGVGSVLDRPDGYYEGKIVSTEVDMKTGKTFMRENNLSNIDICKIDVEGFTYEVLIGFGEKIKDIKFIEAECETSVIWENQKVFKDINNYLINNDFAFITGNVKKRQDNFYWINKKYL